MPKYRGINSDRYPIKKMDFSIEVTLNDKRVHRRVSGKWTIREDPGTYFWRMMHTTIGRDCNSIGQGDYEDNAERFVFLCRAAIEMALASGTHYDVYHCHDWQASLTPVYLRSFYAGEPRLADAASVVTIHNLGYQGRFWYLDMPLVGVGWELFTPAFLEFYGDINLLKGGIVFADQVNTVFIRIPQREYRPPSSVVDWRGSWPPRGTTLRGLSTVWTMTSGTRPKIP